MKNRKARAAKEPGAVGGRAENPGAVGAQSRENREMAGAGKAENPGAVSAQSRENRENGGQKISRYPTPSSDCGAAASSALSDGRRFSRQSRESGVWVRFPIEKRLSPSSG